MTISTASLHILLPDPTLDARGALLAAYASLGFAPSQADTVGAREAVLAHAGGFMSVYDSICAHEDDGTLRALACRLSSALRTVALVTSLQDGEDFEFLLFHLGVLVDSAVGDADGPACDLPATRGRLQAEIWRAALGEARFSTLPHRAGDVAEDPADRFSAIAQAARRETGGGAAGQLGAWCRLAGLPARAALRGFTDAAASPANRRLALIAADKAHPAPILSAQAGYDEFPYHRFFPAAWPVQAGADASFTWPILCRNRGVENPRILLHVEQSGGFLTRHVSLSAHSAPQGRIASASPLASFGQAILPPSAQREADIAIDAIPFNLPAPPGGAGCDYLLLLRIEFRAPLSGEAMVTPTLRAGPPDAPALLLPPLRLAARAPGWVPVVSDPWDESPARRQAVLRLNAPACLTQVAILADSGEELRASVRGMIESWLLPMTDTDLVATIRMQKHPAGEEARPPAPLLLPAAALPQGPVWPKLFQAARDMQSVQVEIGAPGSDHGLAGFCLQTSLREAGGPAAAGATLAVSLWALADEAALGRLRLDMVQVRAGFAAWARSVAPLQAWMADCAWIPSFDTYQSYAVTLYEAAACIDWVGTGLAGTLCDPAWPRRRLRFAARHLWLGWELAAHVDTTSLADIARVTSYPDGVELELHPQIPLAILERRLVPVLPLQL